MYYIGIDPGVAGGIAILGETGLIIDTTKMLATDRELLEWVQGRSSWFGNAERRAHAALERVNAGVFGKAGRMGVVSAFTFGKGVGRLEMMLAALAIPFDLISPQTWQAALSCRTGGDKNVSKRRAEQLFPHVKVTHAIADALLLAEYCRRLHTGRTHDRLRSENGEEKNGQAVGQLLEAEGAREGERSEALATDLARFQAGEAGLTAKERREAGSAPRDGAGPKRKARSVVRIVG